MTDLIDTTEMYLRTILELEEENIIPLRARISERLSHSGPTVSQTVGRMERDGLVVVSEDRTLELTDSGRRKAVDVMRKHRLAERLLVDVIGLEWEYAHDEACRWEHVISETVELRLFSILDRPSTSPYGNVIPALNELGGPEDAAPAGERLSELLADDGTAASVRLVRIGEGIQPNISLLERLAQDGVVPDAELLAAFEGTSLVLRAQAADAGQPGCIVPRDLAEHLFVQPLGPEPV